MTRLFTWLSALGLLASVGVRGDCQSARATPRRFALLLGVSAYPSPLPSLKGASLNDVALMRELLVTRLGFDDANIVTLTDQAVTRDSVIALTRSHLGQASPEDVVLLYYSGHGLQVDAALKAAAVSDSEPDQLDEALLIWHRNGKHATYLLDDEVGVLLDGLRARRTIVIIDACHSGTATRAVMDEDVPLSALGKGSVPSLPVSLGDDVPGFVPKRALFRELGDVIVKPDSLLIAGERPKRKAHLLFSASQDDEIALAGPLRLPDGSRKRVGLFTTALYLAINAATPATSIDGIMTAVRRAVAPVAQKIQGTPQTPGASGSWRQESLGQLFGTHR